MKLRQLIMQEKRRLPFLCCGILLSMMLLLVGFTQGKNVEIDVDGNVIQLTTMYNDPGMIIRQAGVVLQEKDEYRLSTEDVENNTVITIYRAVPVTVEYQGKKQEIITGKPFVGELLEELGYGGNGFASIPGADTKIQQNLNIKIIAVTEKITEREEQIDYEVKYQPDPAAELGLQHVIQAGKKGTKKVKVKEKYHDGKKIGEEVIESTELVAPVPEIIAQGSRNTVETSRGTVRFTKTVNMQASAYLPTDGGGNGITASGMAARHGVVAVDPKVIPLGTRLYIPGYGMALAADTGGAIKGNRIDLCMESYGEAISFGRRTVKVYIVE